MPVSFLSEAERERFNSFPANLLTPDLIGFFTLSDNDLLQIPKTTTPPNRLGFALRILLLRFLGFHLTDLTLIPVAVTEYVGSQIGTDAGQIKDYAERGATRTVHQRAIEDYLGFRLPTERDFQDVSEWLFERALEHDRPTLLLQLLCERFLAEKLVRPGFSVVERMVATARNALRLAELQELYGQFDRFFDDLLIKHKKKSVESEHFPTSFNPADHLDQKVNIRMENVKLIVTKLPGEEITPSSEAIKQEVSNRLPEIELTDLLIEVDGWTNFSRYFEHPSGNEPRSPDALKHCYACILASACNFGFMQMQRMSGLTYRKMAWHATWYLREETLKSAFSELVNFHSRLPLAALWGGGTLSSSDGQRFPVSVKTRNAVAIPKYFGYGRGLTYYTWTSDQYSQYGTKIVASTIRDATYVLDEILDNETELTILEHTTDTAGYTDLVFGLFDLLGLQFSPRLRDLADKKLYRIDKEINYKNINSLITGKINTDLILRHWDELLRIAGSLKQGYVTASLLIGKFQSRPQKNALTKAIQEYGKLNETIFILKYLQSAEYQKKITVQLNKGEAVQALRRNIFIANEGKIRKRNQEDQLNKAACLNLVVNAITVWNTVYMQAALEQLKVEGYEINDEDIPHLSPARSEHINLYGKYYFNIEEGLKRKGLRQLRKPMNDYPLW